MKFRRPLHRTFANEAEREDFWELSGNVPSSHRRQGAGRKTLQLCSQVADTLSYVLSGECDDELLRDLQVMSVVPAPDASQLLVTVYPVVATDATFDAALVRQRLLAAVGRLRSEVAASITRKKAPKLLFQVVQFVR
jgi:ribosome-binding factor A